ncbi:hypothetical protein [Tautonia plasticadhaerens]|uniref:Uncharacterized protein n=1 Tax=Tautonia plasticadhaerens TaxID=2527974 RepID=A0A518H6D5_9BACT|nr:hypothetical protein [Tautonia plasticadhaerens]QDV36404.1 hypothetical protein ElP_43280 [Tautonia plasticadhaerens]
MTHRAPSLPIAALVVLAGADHAWAGMPSVTLTDLARMRVQTISFFLLGVLLCAWVVQRVWNSLGRDFPRLPRLTFGKALGVVTLWGLLFVLILTMISGARELMTPGAWEKDGYTYTIAGDQPPASPDVDLAGRRQALDRLRIALWTYARSHEGRFPPEDDPEAIPEEAWRVPDPSGMRYLYVPGEAADEGRSIVAYEPGLFDGERLVLRADGRIVSMSPEEIAAGLAGGLAQ